MKHARLIQLLALINTIIAILGCIYFPEYIIYGLIAWVLVNILAQTLQYTDLCATEVLKQVQ